MNIWYAVVLGLVEGVSEFLPISSTAHLKLTESLLGIQEAESGYYTSFNIIIQLGAILSVVVLYGRTLLVDRRVLLRVLIAFLPTGVIGVVAYKMVHELLKSDAVMLWALGLGGVLLIVFERLHTEKPEARDDLAGLSFRHCFLIGLFQSLAMVPGVSRSAATIVGGLLLGIKRRTIVEFSFLLAIPTMAAATGLKLVKDAGSFSTDQVQFLAVGFIVSFVVALLSIRFLLAYVKRFTFIGFGVYRIAAAVVIAWILFGAGR